MRYEQKKGRRIKRFGFYAVTPSNPSWWWSDERSRWTHAGDYDGGGRSSHFVGVRSVRAFRRRMRQWRRYLPPGVRMTLVSTWQGYEVDART